MTRRDAVKLAAVGAALGVGATVARAEDKPVDADPVGWGKEGDQSFKCGNIDQEAKQIRSKIAGMVAPEDKAAGFGLAESDEVMVARVARSNNCGRIKAELTRRFKIVKFGRCDHPIPPSADVEGAVLMAQVIAEGGVRNTEFGHRLVTNRVGPLKYHTYLAYAGGDTI